MSFYVYVLESKKDRKLYIGLTQHIESRLKYHNAGYVQATRHRRPFCVIGSRSFDTLAEAREAEVTLKRFKDSARVRKWIAIH
jgi:putative endonuclease